MEKKTTLLKHKHNRGGVVKYVEMTPLSDYPFVREVLINRCWFTRVWNCKPPSRISLTIEEVVRPGAVKPGAMPINQREETNEDG